MQRIEKPWGYEIWWVVADKYVGKIIHVNQGHALSLQYHNIKHESMYVMAGQAEITVNNEVRHLTQGEFLTIPPKMIHRVVATTDVDIMEVSTPELDDVVRLEDRYGREDS